MKVAFSTVACPDWCLQRVASEGEAAGFNAVELRTFGSAGAQFACEPFLTDPAKIRTMMSDAGLEIVSLATGLKFDDPISPPLLGYFLGDQEKAIRECKLAIELAAQLECPFVRVFGFEIPGNESRKSATARIVDRLGKCLDACDRTGVKILIENGGSYARAAELVEILDGADNALLAASYSVAVAAQVGDDVAAGVALLDDRLGMIKVKDFRHGTSVKLGSGEVPNCKAVCAARSMGFKGPLVFEFDRAWNPALGDPAAALRDAAPVLHGWAYGKKNTCVPVHS